MTADPNPIILPDAVYDPYTNKNQTPVQVDFLVLHTEAGTNEGSIQVGGQAGHSYAHNYTDCLGVTHQKQSLRYRSAACLDANPYAIAWETEDMDSRCFPFWGNSCGNVPAWTEAQIERLSRDLAFCCMRFNVPAALVPDTRLGRRGIAYHRQGVPGSPEWVTGALRMSSVEGKCCPDWRRIDQVISRIIPRVNQIIASWQTPTPEPTLEELMKLGTFTLVNPNGSFWLVYLDNERAYQVDGNDNAKLAASENVDTFALSVNGTDTILRSCTAYGFGGVIYPPQVLPEA